MARKFMKANIGESQSQRLSDIMAKLKPFCQLPSESVRYLRSICIIVAFIQGTLLPTHLQELPAKPGPEQLGHSLAAVPWLEEIPTQAPTLTSSYSHKNEIWLGCGWNSIINSIALSQLKNE